MSDKKQLRIFISSPSDVRPERLIAERVIERLAREFSYHFAIEPVLWEREPLVATEHFQTMITPPSETDIAVVILWSQLGTPLPPDEFKGAISHETVTGTEWEFEDAVAANRRTGRPDLLLYRKVVPVLASLEDDAALERQREQKRRVERFIKRWFVDDESGTFKAASLTFQTPDEFEEMLETHLRALLRQHLDLPEDEVVRAGIRWHQGTPYRGLESFEIEHAPIFFGRTRARNELRQALVGQATRGCAFVLVFGASGSGKSSLVKAGLLPDITLPGMVGNIGLCRYAVFRPGDAKGAPIVALAEALFQDTALPELGELEYDPAQIADHLVKAPEHAPVRQALARARKAAELTERAEARLCLVVDQLEELFTLDGLTDEARRHFVAALEALARSGLVWVVATMRSDFFDRLETMPALAALSEGEGRYLLTPPDEAEIGQVIRQPAREAGLRFEIDTERGVGLEEVIRQAAGRNPSALPLLEFTLDQLWRRRTGGGELTFAAYESLGGLEGALGRRAEEEYAKLSEDVQAALPSVLRALVTVGQGERAEATAQRAPLDAFVKGSPQRKLVEAFLDPAARLLVADGDGTGATVRVAHEALLEHWPRARDQIATDRDFLQARARVARAAELWHREAETPDRLLPAGKPLAEATDMLRTRRSDLEPDLIAYIEASARAAEARQHRRLRVVQATAAVFAVLALAAGGAGYMAYQQSVEAEAARAVAESERAEADAARDDAETHRQAAEAARDDAEAQRQEAERNATVARLRAESAEILNSLSILPKEALIQATKTFDSNRKLLGPVLPSVRFALTSALDASREVKLIDGNDYRYFGSFESLEASPDGKHFALRSSDMIWIVDRDGTLIRPPIAAPDRDNLLATGVAWSPDSQYLAIASERISDGEGKLRAIFPDNKPTEIFNVPKDGEGVSPFEIETDSAQSRIIWLWNFNTNEITIVTDNHPGIANVVRFGPDGRTILTGGTDGRLRRWTLEGKPIGEPVMAHPGGVSQILWDSHRALFVTAGGNPTSIRRRGANLSSGLENDAQTDSDIRFWSPELKSAGRPLTAHIAEVNTLAISENGEFMVSGDKAGILYVWEKRDEYDKKSPDDNWRRGSILKGHVGEVTSAAFHPSGDAIVSAGEDGSLRVWSISGAALGPSLIGHNAPVWGVAVLDDGQQLMSVGNDVRIWKFGGMQIGNAVAVYPRWIAGEVTSAFSTNGKAVAAVNLGDVIVSDIHGKQIAKFEDLGERSLTRVAPGNGDQFVYVASSIFGSGDQGSKVYLLIPGQTQPPAKLIDIPGEVGQLAVSSPHQKLFLGLGNSLIAASRDAPTSASGLQIWNNRGELLTDLTAHYDLAVTSIALSDKTQIVATGDISGEIRLWKFDGQSLGDPIRFLPSHQTGEVTALAISPDGWILASAFTIKEGISVVSQVIKVWDIRKKVLISSVRGHAHKVNALAFNQDGDVLAGVTGNAGLFDLNISGPSTIDYSARLWSVSGIPLSAPLVGHGSPVVSVAFSEDGRLLRTVDATGEMRTWHANVDELFQEAMRRRGNYEAKSLSDRVLNEEASLRKQKKYQEAIALLDEVIASQPDNGSLYNRRALGLEKSGKSRQVISDYSRAIQLKPNEPIYYYNRGLARLQTNDFAGAESDHTVAIRMGHYVSVRPVQVIASFIALNIQVHNFHLRLVNTAVGENHYHRGLARMGLNKIDGAVEDFNSAIELGYRNDWSYFQRSHAHARQGRLRAALQDIESAIAIDDKTATYHAQRGDLLAKQKKAGPSIAAFEMAVELAPKDGHIRLRFGKVRYLFGDAAGAVQEWEQARSLLGKTGEELLARLAAGYWRLGEEEKATEYFKAAVEAEPKFLDRIMRGAPDIYTRSLRSVHDMLQSREPVSSD